MCIVCLLSFSIFVFADHESIKHQNITDSISSHIIMPVIWKQYKRNTFKEYKINADKYSSLYETCLSTWICLHEMQINTAVKIDVDKYSNLYETWLCLHEIQVCLHETWVCINETSVGLHWKCWSTLDMFVYSWCVLHELVYT